MKNCFRFLSVVVLSVLISGCLSQSELVPETEAKLYWFIPDGMRADPTLFDIFAWAEEGTLPNLQRMMQEGSYGFSKPTFPSHTPTNFATLFTGTFPVKHGVADGPMHTVGNPLSKVSVGGFSSAAKKVDPIWVTLERAYGQSGVLLSVPGSTPPELERGITIRGRWGGWGADFHATNFEQFVSRERVMEQGRGARLFFFGPPLTRYVWDREPSEWIFITSYSPAKEIHLAKYGQLVYGYVYDSTDDGVENYDRIAFSFDKQKIIVDLQQGEWSDWLPTTLLWNAGERKVPVETFFKINIIKLDDNGFYRIRFFFNNINQYNTEPSIVAEELIEGVGPMVDFVDNFPPQLIFYPEDKKTFLEEAHLSLDWHRAAASFVLEKYDPDFYIHDIYTPNQLLTSRWWIGYVDPTSSRYSDVTDEERDVLWEEVQDVYRKLDAILGEILEKADEHTYVVLSSDHGAVPLDRWVRLNNLFAEKGWLKFTFDSETGEPIINWDASTVIYLKMAHVYIDSDGLGGNWERASGAAYEALREEVAEVLLGLEDPETGIHPAVSVENWEDAPAFFQLPVDRVGDLVLANEAGYGWNEEVTADGAVFDVPLKTGYKQAILADEEQGMWTPFVIVGPGIKKGYKLKEPIRHVDQYATLMTLLGRELSDQVDGEFLDEIVE